jgi:peptide/nickel transport system permease protein
VAIRLRRHEPVVSEAGKEKMRLSAKRSRKTMSQLLHNPMGVIGLAILVFFILMAALGPIIAPYDVHKIDLPNKYKLPDPDHWMGRDNFGIDIFSELLNGARTSIIVGIFSAVIASFLGAAVGLYSGYVGGWKDEVIMRLNDIVLSIPWLVLMIIVAAMVGKIDLTGIILIIGLTGWSTTARMVRAQVLSVKERQYIERARAIGASEMSIIRRHIFPNTFPLVFANTILTVAVSILSEATLSFLGLRPVGVVTWGTMLSYASDASAFHIGLHWWILAPGLCIVAVVLGFTLLGYALDEILNPKLRHR